MNDPLQLQLIRPMGIPRASLRASPKKKAVALKSAAVAGELAVQHPSVKYELSSSVALCRATVTYRSPLFLPDIAIASSAPST